MEGGSGTRKTGRGIQIVQMRNSGSVPGSAKRPDQTLLAAISNFGEEKQVCWDNTYRLILPGGPQSLAPVLRRLLGDASAALDRDTDTVRACLTQARQEQRVRRHIEAHLDQPIRVIALAEISGLSAGHFSVAFRTTFGSSVRTYLAHRRIERAQMLMLSSRGSLADIALNSGFCDQAHLCRMFRRITGQTPNVWRRTYAGARQ
jgi:AraC-like DNA-binding protein